MHNPLIVALDVSSKKEALSIVKELKDNVPIFKIGPVLFTRYGPEIVREIKKLGAEVFLDLKLHDIPNTVASAVKNITELGVSMFTVHIQGGMEMLKAAVEAARQGPSAPKVLGVTVLTSIADAPLDEVIGLANLAKKAGLDGVITSPQEIEPIRKALGKDFLIVTPGVRPKGADAGDQRRIATPKEAVKKGADYIVIGRPIIKSSKPKEVVEHILDEITT